MKCRVCQFEIDTSKREQDGSLICPSCGTVYRRKAKQEQKQESSQPVKPVDKMTVPFPKDTKENRVAEKQEPENKSMESAVRPENQNVQKPGVQLPESISFRKKEGTVDIPVSQFEAKGTGEGQETLVPKSMTSLNTEKESGNHLPIEKNQAIRSNEKPPRQKITAKEREKRENRKTILKSVLIALAIMIIGLGVMFLTGIIKWPGSNNEKQNEQATATTEKEDDALGTLPTEFMTISPSATGSENLLVVVTPTPTPAQQQNASVNQSQAGSQTQTGTQTQSDLQGQNGTQSGSAPISVSDLTGQSGTATQATAPTRVPTTVPTSLPTRVPTAVPTSPPTRVPTVLPTMTPTSVPTTRPTQIPTASPTNIPTTQPTVAHTATNTITPTNTPTPTKTPAATSTNIPTQTPTSLPTSTPTMTPTENPTVFVTPSDYPFLIMTTGKRVIVRQRPDPNSARITYIVNEGTKVLILDETTGTDGDAWYKVLTDTGDVGYVQAGYFQ